MTTPLTGPATRCKVLQIDRPETELLLHCVRSGVGADLTGTIRDDLKQDINWTLFTQIADHHKVIPLVCRQLGRISPDLLAQPALNNLMERFRGIVARNLHLTKELLRLLQLLQDNDVAAVTFKGPLLAVSAFGNLSSRDFGDLDLLLRPADIPKARRLLASVGYRSEHILSDVQEAAYIKSEHAFQYLRDQDHLVVELHWRLQDRYLSFPLDKGVWSNLCQSELFGRPVLSLSPEYLFLYLCMHGAKHYWHRLEWICCLPAVILAHPDMKWPVIIEQARRLGGMRMLQLGLLLANELNDTESTRAPLRLINGDPVAKELAAWVWKHLFVDGPSGAQREVYRFRFYLMVRERLWDRVRIVRFASIRIPHPDSSAWETSLLPKSLLSLHYFLRPMRLLRIYGLEGVRGVFYPKCSREQWDNEL